MNREDVPIVRHMADVGPTDAVFDTLMLLGPVVILLIDLLGRSLGTMALAGGYLAAFVCYTAYKAVDYPRGRLFG